MLTVSKVIDNAYKAEPFGEYGVSTTFSVAYLQPCYVPSEIIPSLRTHFSGAEGSDESDSQLQLSLAVDHCCSRITNWVGS